MTTYDVIIIGAGSVGVPTAYFASKAGLKVLVIDKNASVGQGENKHAIGGVRATHTSKAKILCCQRSIDVFSNWEKEHGEPIDWQTGGYCFVVYTEEHEKMLKDAIIVQKSYGLDIDWVGPEKVQELAPGINPKGLRGGTWSPGDGNLNPMKAIIALYFQSLQQGAEFRFKEEVTGFEVEEAGDQKKIVAVKTNTGNAYKTKWVVNASGPYARELGKLLDLDLPVEPDSHEAGVTEPVKPFFTPMLVDLREDLGSKNYYFYQDAHGSLVFCITPEPLIKGKDKQETSVFLPQVSKRMVDLIPRLKNLKVRRTWRGLYPMTPDGSPIVGLTKEYTNLVNEVGMCGQGLMLGPGVGELVTKILTGTLSPTDEEMLDELSLYREFSAAEKLK